MNFTLSFYYNNIRFKERIPALKGLGLAIKEIRAISSYFILEISYHMLNFTI